MSDTKKAGVVTAIYRAAQEAANHSPDSDLDEVLAALEVTTDELIPGMLEALDLVAESAELREVVGLVQALTPEGKAVLPKVLLGMATHPEDCAVLEAGLGRPVSVAAKMAAWAGGLSQQDAQLLYAELMAAAWRHRDQQRHGTANACVTMAEGLRSCLGDVLKLNAARILASRMPRRQLKGTCPEEVIPGQVRELDGTAWKVESVEGIKARITHPKVGATTVHLDHIRTWPLSEDFEPKASDLSGLAKPEPRVWKAGTVPPVVLPGMRRMSGTGNVWTVETMLSGHVAPDEWYCSREVRALLDGAAIREWPLAEDFPIPEDA